MAYKIVFFDIDGTLLDDEKRMPADTADAVRRLQRRGVRTVIATGRAPYFFQSLAEELGIDSYICLNGSRVVCRGQVIYDRPIPRANLENLTRLAAVHGHPLVFQGAEAFNANADAHPDVVESVSTLKVGLPGYDPDYWKRTNIYQAFLHCREGEQRPYEEALADLRFVRWHPKAMDVLPASVSKADGIAALLRHEGLDPEEAVAFGDGLNDKEMLSFVGLGIAMGNAHEELKPLAGYVTTAVDRGGILGGLRYAGLL